MLGDLGRKTLRLSPWRLNFVQNEVGSEIGCEVGDPPNATKKTFVKNTLYYQEEDDEDGGDFDLNIREKEEDDGVKVRSSIIF
jgi:hypothetical protein